MDRLSVAGPEHLNVGFTVTVIVQLVNGAMVAGQVVIAFQLAARRPRRSSCAHRDGPHEGHVRAGSA
jgi:hypothetical protein